MRKKYECQYCGKLLDNLEEANKHEQECRETFYTGEFLNEEHKLMLEGYKACHSNLEMRCEQMIKVSQNDQEVLGGTIWDMWWEIVQEFDFAIPIKAIEHIVSQSTKYLLSIIHEDICDYVSDLKDTERKHINK